MLISTPVLLILCLSLPFALPDDYEDEQNHKKTMDTVNDVVEAITAICDVLAFLTPPPYSAAFSAVASLGGIVSMFTTVSRPSPVDLKLDKLSNNLGKMAENMAGNFDDLAALIVGHGFIKDVIIKIDKMEALMRNYLLVPSKALRRQFLHEAKKHNPLELIRQISGRLRHNETNPLLHAMEADKYKTEATFRKWKIFTVGATTRLAFIHSFYTGVNTKNGQPPDASIIRISHLLEKALKEVNDHVKAFDSGYWPDTVKKVVQECQSTYKSHNRFELGEEIRKRLNRTHTTDELYIIVYGNVHGDDNHWVTGTKEDEYEKDIASDRVYRSMNRNDSNVIILRSKERHFNSNTTTEDMAKIKRVVLKHTDSKIVSYIKNDEKDGKPGLKDPHTTVLNELPANSTLAIVFTEKAYVNSTSVGAVTKESPEWYGPGWWTHRDCKWKNDDDTETVKCLIVAGYR